jgi:hypothetical protein
VSLSERLLTFFTSRVDARPLAVARIIIGGAAFLRGLVSYHLFDRALTPGVVQARLFESVPFITREALPWYVGIWLFAAGAFTLGYRTRLNGSILFALIIYHLAVGQTFYSSHVYFLCCLILLLTIADCGADLSFDWHASSGGRATVPVWGVTLLKVHITIVYAIAALAKINPSFLSGEVIGRALIRPDFVQTPEIILALTWGTILFEAAMAFALWIKPFRLWAIAGGVVFHAMITISMGFYGGLIVFSASIIGTFVLFLDREEFAAAERFVVAGLARLRLIPEPA